MFGKTDIKGAYTMKLKGVIFFGWMTILTGVLGLINIILAALMPHEVVKNVRVFEDAKINVFSPIIWIGVVILGRNLINLKEWARKTLVILISLSIIILLVRVFSVLAYGLVFILTFLLIEVFYLTRPAVRIQFKK